MCCVSPWLFWAHPFILALSAQGVREGPQWESRGHLGWGLSKWEGRMPFAQDEVTILEERHPLQAACYLGRTCSGAALRRERSEKAFRARTTPILPSRLSPNQSPLVRLG